MADPSNAAGSPTAGWNESGNDDDLWPDEDETQSEQVPPATLGLVAVLAFAALATTAGTIIAALH